MRGVLAHEEALCAGLGLGADKRMGHCRRVGHLLQRRPLSSLLARQFAAVDNANPVGLYLVGVAQPLLSEDHVRETGVAAVRRYDPHVKDCRQRLQLAQGFVGVPCLRRHPAARLALRPEIVDDVHQRMVARPPVGCDMPLQRTKLLGEDDLLVFRQALVAESEDMMTDGQLIDPAASCGFGRPPQVEADNLGAGNLGKPTDL